MKFLLDSNTYIQAKNLCYGMKICPAYWDWLDQQFENTLLDSVEMVGRELKDGNDELADWAKNRPAHFIENDDEETQEVFSGIVELIMARGYNSGNRDNFLAKADPWIIAKAKAIGATVVSHESRKDNSTKKVKVPNICNDLGVPCITTFDLLNELQARFVLGED